jgi:ATP-dependent DNA helicase RecG
VQQPIIRNDPEIFSTEKENLYFDRKSARLNAKETARHICAFSNASGGKLVIGIEDDGEITGFKRDGARDIEDFEQAPIVGCDPVPVVQAARIPVTNAKGEDDQILVLEISRSNGHVIARRSDKAVFLRQRDSSVELDRDQVLALEYDKNQRRYEDEVQERASLEDVDPEVMARYKTDLGTEVPDEQVLRSRGMLVDGHLTNAGVILFARNPAQFMPQARVRVVRFDGNKMETGRRLNIVKERTFDGPLPKVIEGAKEFISSQLREFQYLGDDGRFKVVPEYP